MSDRRRHCCTRDQCDGNPHEVSDEAELQAILDAAPEHVEDPTLVMDDPELGKLWAWEIRDATHCSTIRIQERLNLWNGNEIVQRTKVIFDDGTSMAWTLWYSALEKGAIRRGE